MTIHISGQAASEDGLLDGALPVKQRRGRDTRDRLLEAGHALSATRDIDAITVAEIAHAATCSIGAFYQRFRDKDAFFGVLVSHYLAEARAATIALFAEEPDEARLIALLVTRTVERFRRHAGLIRTATRRRMDDDALWQPIRASGYFVADRMIERLAQRRGKPLSAAEELSARFAFQVLFGTLNNAVINRPGPLELEDAAFTDHLERAFRLALLGAAEADNG